jgi:hypothetical protein
MLKIVPEVQAKPKEACSPALGSGLTSDKYQKQHKNQN